MAYYDTIQLVKGDTLPEINFTLRDSNTAADGTILDELDASTWAPIDLTGATVRLKFRALGADTAKAVITMTCLLYTSPSPRDQRGSRMPSSA